MGNASLNILLVAEGSGGHLIPALQVAQRLAQRGARIQVWYAKRPQTAPLVHLLSQDAIHATVEMNPIVVEGTGPIHRLWQCGQLWHQAQRCFDTFAPDVVVGFGGWVSAPIVLAARKRQISCLLHEQNVMMGKANQWLVPWVDRVAVSFSKTQAAVNGTRSVVTGMPVREAIGQWSRDQAARYFLMASDRPTLLVLGGSQGSRAVNRLMMQALPLLSSSERQTWQVIHICGAPEEAAVGTAYVTTSLTAWVAPFLATMEAAYALADLVIARAGASTIAELARVGVPAILVPYPYAGGHQRANAELVEEIGGGLMLEESEATPERLLASVRRILTDARLRTMMARQMQALNTSDAIERLTQTIMDAARHPSPESPNGAAHADES